MAELKEVTKLKHPEQIQKKMSGFTMLAYVACVFDSFVYQMVSKSRNPFLELWPDVISAPDEKAGNWLKKPLSPTLH